MAVGPSSVGAEANRRHNGLSSRALALVVCGCIAAGLALACMLRTEGLADSPLSWSPSALIDPGPLAAGPAGLSGVSCPSASLCVAVDRAGNVVSSTSPTGSASAWTIAHVDPTSSSGCIIGSCHGLTGVSCASATLCVAVDDQGNVITSSSPMGGPSAWKPVNIDSKSAGCGYSGNCYGLTGVSCPSASLCVAVDAVGNVFTSTNPGGGASAWRTADVDGSSTFCTPASGCFGLNRVSCSSASLCVAVDANLNVIMSTNPTGGRGAWKVTPVRHGGLSPLGLSGVSCASSVLCVAVDQGGDAFASTDPTGGRRAWPLTNIDGNGVYRYLTDVSCAPRTSLCIASDTAGNVVTSSDPVGGPGAWTLASLGAGAIPELPCATGSSCRISVLCASGSFCLAVDGGDRAVVGRGSPPPPPINTSPPSISGHAVVGRTLTEAHGAWTNRPAVFGYQWQDCNRSVGGCTAIPGATSQTMVPRAMDVGHRLRVQETAMNAGGTSSPASGSATAVVRPQPSVAQIRAQLLRNLAPAGKASRIAALVKKGAYVLQFRALTAGKAVIAWYLPPRCEGKAQARARRDRPADIHQGRHRQRVNQTNHDGKAAPQARPAAQAHSQGHVHPDRQARHHRHQDLHAQALTPPAKPAARSIATSPLIDERQSLPPAPSPRGTHDEEHLTLG